MAQVSSGVRAILSSPVVYETFERTIGSRNVRRTFIDRYVGPGPGDSVLDIGCGPGDIITALPDGVRYTGFDPNPAYITSATERYGARGSFFVGGIDDVDPETLGTFDIVMAKSVLHHLDDDQCHKVFEAAKRCVKPGGRLVTLDAAFTPKQNPIARFIIKRDRGQNVRTEPAYRALAEQHFDEVEAFLHHDLLRVPYTHIILVCRSGG